MTPATPLLLCPGGRGGWREWFALSEGGWCRVNEVLTLCIRSREGFAMEPHSVASTIAAPMAPPPSQWGPTHILTHPQIDTARLIWEARLMSYILMEQTSNRSNHKKS